MDQRCFALSRAVPGAQQLQLKWAALHDGAGGLRRPEVREVDESSIGTVRATQHDFSRYPSENRTPALLTSLDAATEEGERASARLCWLDTLPFTQALELKSGEFQRGLRHHLGTTILPPNRPLCNANAARPSGARACTTLCNTLPSLQRQSCAMSL
jgi:hypothetical protein